MLGCNKYATLVDTDRGEATSEGTWVYGDWLHFLSTFAVNLKLP